MRSHIQSKNKLIVLLCDQFQKGHGTVSPLKTLVVPSALVSLFNLSRSAWNCFRKSKILC